MKYKVPFINYPLHYQKMKKGIDAAIQDVLNRGDLILRQDVAQFEKNLARLVEVKYTVGVNSCTDALIFSLKAAGIGQNDEVITTAHTFVATIAAIIHCGAKPILIDIADDYNINPDQIETVITRQTKAIIPVHFNGRVCQMDKIIALAKKYRLVIIEDAAQALGGSFKNKKAGAFGLTGCFSFYPAKLLGAFGDGGAVTTNSKIIADKIRLFRDHGRATKNKLVCYGFTSRLDNLQAAILNVKLKYVPDWIKKRRQLAMFYQQNLAGISQVILPPPPQNSDSFFDVYQNYVIRAPKRNQLANYLKNQSIETIISNPVPIHKQKALGLTRFSLPNTEKFARQVISLPLNPELTQSQIQYVSQKIKDFYEKK